jgi:hypothetical protein
MKINFVKSNMMVVGVEEEETNILARLFYCKIGISLLPYLGIPLYHVK